MIFLQQYFMILDHAALYPQLNKWQIVLQNDHDPSRLLAETPCKLLRFLIADGAHVDADVPYAEVEVMKMCMPLLAPAAGVINVLLSEGQAMQVILLHFRCFCC